MDTFDTLLNKTCTILAREAADSYNQAGPPTVVVESGVPCRLSIAGGGTQKKTGQQTAISTYRVFMRVTAVDEHNWLQIDGKLYDIKDVQNPGGMDHHLEVLAELVTP